MDADMSRTYLSDDGKTLTVLMTFTDESVEALKDHLRRWHDPEDL